MIKKLANLSLIYAIIAMAAGVFYREFTKIMAFDGNTRLSIIHTHYFVLGMVFFLLLMLMEKNFSFSEQKNTGVMLVLYQIGLNITGLGFLVRGITQVLELKLGSGTDAAISGISGLGHIILGITIVFFLIRIKKKA